MKIFYFTSTGNSLYIAKNLGGEVYSMPQLIKNNNFQFEDDIIGFVFPIYGFAAPEIVREFIKKVKIKSKYTFVVTTYGNYSGGCGKWFAKLALENGINIDYSKSIKMVDNYLPVFDISKQILMDKDIPQQLSKIKIDISEQKHEIEAGSVFLTNATQLFAKAMLTICKKFTINDSCNACGTCAKVYQRKNIIVDKIPQFGSDCEGCLGCVNICPKSSIIIKGEKNPKIRFRNENISIKDIIDSNNRIN